MINNAACHQILNVLTDLIATMFVTRRLTNAGALLKRLIKNEIETGLMHITSLSISAKRQQTMMRNCNKNFIKNCSKPCKIIQRTSEINVKRNFHFDVPSTNNWQRFISGKFNLYFLINAIWQTQNRCFPANRYFELRN